MLVVTHLAGNKLLEFALNQGPCGDVAVNVTGSEILSLLSLHKDEVKNCWLRDDSPRL